MFGLGKKRVRIPVPGTAAVILDDASHQSEVERQLQSHEDDHTATMDETLAESFPASDPPSTLPAPKPKKAA